MLSISFHIDISGNEPASLVKLLWRGDAFVFIKGGIHGFSTDGKRDRYLFAECVYISGTVFFEKTSLKTDLQTT